MKKKIAVIGAGIVGSSIAYALSKRNVEVHIFDKSTDINAPTLYSFAWLNAFRKTPLDYYLFYEMGQHRWPWFNTELGGNCDLNWCGALSIPLDAAGEKTLKTNLESLLKWGYAVDVVNQKALAKVEPTFDFNNISWAAHSPDEGFVDAAKCTRRLLELAQKNGAKVHRPQKVTRLINRNKRIESVYIDDQAYSFDEVVLASGETVGELAATAGVTILQGDNPVFLVQTAPCNDRFKTVGVLHLFSESLREVRQNRDGSIWIADPGAPNATYPRPEEKGKQLLNELARLFKPAEQLSFTHRIINVPKPVDGKALFGYSSEAENLYIALSHSAVVVASVIGPWVTREIVDKVPVHWFEQFRLEKKGSK